jgi:predicted kinase
LTGCIGLMLRAKFHVRRSIGNAEINAAPCPAGDIDEAGNIVLAANVWGAMARLIALAGLPGVGKSSIARHLARRAGAVWLRIDSMDQAIWASGTAPADLLDWTYRAAQAIAADNLFLDRDVVADCVNDCEAARDGWEAAASRAGADIVWLEIVCSDPVEHRHRIETRSTDIAGLNLPDWNAIEARAYHEWNRDRLIIDTAHRSLEDCVEEVLILLSR